MKATPLHFASTTRPARRARGYTLVEVLMVVVIVGIAAAVVVPQMLEAGSMQIQSAGRMVIADIIYAQNEAIAQQANRKLVFDPAQNSYKITDASGNALASSWRMGGGGTTDYTVSFTGDSRFDRVKLSAAAFNNATTLEFDPLGGPLAGGTVDLVSGNLKYRISVADYTGRVTIAPVP